MKGRIHHLKYHRVSINIRFEKIFSLQLTHTRGEHRYLNRPVDPFGVLPRDTLSFQMSQLKSIMTTPSNSVECGERYKSLNNP